MALTLSRLAALGTLSRIAGEGFNFRTPRGVVLYIDDQQRRMVPVDFGFAAPSIGHLAGYSETGAENRST